MSKLGRVLLVVGIVLMVLTAAITLLSGAGTSCVAWGAEKYPPFRAIVPYKPLYQALVVLTIADALAAVWAILALVRRSLRAFAAILIVLVGDLILTAIQMYFSHMLRGSTMPSDLRLYVALVTLIYFLLWRVPGVRKHVDVVRFESGAGRAAGAGLAMFVAGVAALSTPMWAGPTHMLEGYNLVYVLEAPLFAGGGALTLAGLCLLVGSVVALPSLRLAEDPSHPR